MVTILSILNNFLQFQGMNAGRGLGAFGLLGLAAAGFVGYKVFSNKSAGVGLKRSWLPWKKSVAILPGGGIANSGIATTGVSSWNTGLPLASGFNTGITGNVAKAPIVHNRKVPMKERLLSKVTGRPVVTNYH